MKHKIFIMVLLLSLLVCSIATAEDATIILLSNDGIRCDGKGVTVSGTTVTITTPGTYRISGTLSDGQIQVDCRDKGEVTLILDGVQLHSERSAALLIDQVKPLLRILLAEGSANTLSGGAHYDTDKDEEPNGVIFSRSDLCIGGTGMLAVDAACYDGIVSKDTLCIEDGTLVITAARHGLRGKDRLDIQSGHLTITCGKDALRSTNERDSDCGLVTISGGTIVIACGDDPIDAAQGYTMLGGTLTADIRDDLAYSEE